MGLSTSLYTGVSGLLAHGDKMQVLGNNIANVNTVGFKGSRMDFEDFIYEDFSTANGITQLGRGVAIGANFTNFGQGAFETTTEATDLAIGGKGFFKVGVKNTDQAFYTRAGNFRFDKDGFLVDPHGYVLQGWEIQPDPVSVATGSSSGTEVQSAIVGSGSPTDIRLDGLTAEPQHTQEVTVITNLDARDGGDLSQLATDPFFAMFSAWDAQTNPDEPLDESAYAYQNTIKIFDEGGNSHNMTIYFDQVGEDSISGAGNSRYWEFMVTVDPSVDGRTLSNGGGALVQTASGAKAGVMMIGTLEFNSAGQIDDMSAFTLNENSVLNTSADMANLSNWKPADFSQSGYPIFAPNFSGNSNASFTGAENAFNVSVNMGVRNQQNPGIWQGSSSNASQVGTNANNLIGFGTFAEPQSLATTSFSGSSSTLFQTQDGYSFGFLQNVTVNRDGILEGRYSNGVTLELYQVTLYDFASKSGLRREGGNLFAETRDSGPELPGPANNNGYGSISSNSLEQSNIDLAREFVTMITTQRGFQANSKVITTTDTMLGEVIALKR